MAFLQQKKDVLDKLYLLDKSKKGSVDTYLIPLIDLINKLPNYYTTSSCSGRISLFTQYNTHHKANGEWLFVSHKTISYTDISSALSSLPDAEVYFRVEGFILHVACESLEDAKRFIQKAGLAGFKNASLLSFKKNIVQIVDTHRLDILLADRGSLLVSTEYVQKIISKANDLLERTHQRIDTFYTLLQS